jgi:predicted MFS family arabinose efflux permease
MLKQETRQDNLAKAGIVCGVLGFAVTNVMYWLVVPGLVLGLAAAVLGWMARRRGHREIAAVAITLGVVTMLLVPSFISNANSAEDWGRDCALDPEHDPNC